MFWFLLVVGILYLALSIHMAKLHSKLDDELTYGSPRNVDYGEYLLTGFYAFLVLPASCLLIIGSLFVIIGEFIW